MNNTTLKNLTTAETLQNGEAYKSIESKVAAGIASISGILAPYLLENGDIRKLQASALKGEDIPHGMIPQRIGEFAITHEERGYDATLKLTRNGETITFFTTSTADGISFSIERLHEIPGGKVAKTSIVTRTAKFNDGSTSEVPLFFIDRALGWSKPSSGYIWKPESSTGKIGVNVWQTPSNIPQGFTLIYEPGGHKVVAINSADPMLSYRIDESDQIQIIRYPNDIVAWEGSNGSGDYQRDLEGIINEIETSLKNGFHDSEAPILS